ncbi:MAG: hypothetical protein ACYTGX_17440 [Planctomycetota bacterium]|jgi:hypothetical protein
MSHEPSPPGSNAEDRRDVLAALAELDAGAEDDEARRDLKLMLLQYDADEDPLPRLVVSARRTITLECVDSDGRPVAGAKLQLFGDAGPAQLELVATTDAHGVATLYAPRELEELDFHGTTAAGDDFYRQSITLKPGVERYRIVALVERLLALDVRWPVDTLTDAMLFHLEWKVFDAASGQAIGSAYLRRGNGDGARLFLPGGRLRLEAASRDGVYAGTAVVDSRTAATVRVDLRATVALSPMPVRVVDGAGAPVAGVTVQAVALGGGRDRLRWAGPTGDDGRFVFPVVAGEYHAVQVSYRVGRVWYVGLARSVTVPRTEAVTVAVAPRK